jgi:GTP 3',8-cyclase
VQLPVHLLRAWTGCPARPLLTDDEVSGSSQSRSGGLGITEVRFTGGEPFIRRGLRAIIARTAALEPRPEISLTTNGIGLARLAGRSRLRKGHEVG